MISRPLTAAAVLLALATQVALADTEEPPLFVGPDGVDTGSCADEAAPCATLDFALQRVGKNGRIRVAAGDYRLQEPGTVMYLVSDAVDERAEPGTNLIGIPHEFAGDLRTRGFRVIADSKGLDRDVQQKLLTTRNVVETSAQATACVGGNAGGFPCTDVDLLGRVQDRSAAAAGADIWGFLDLNTQREYALMGYSTGTAVYDVTDPENPREVGFVDGQRTTWRDIKVYQFWNDTTQRYDAYAYVTADNASDGLFIIDLTDLPQRIARVAYASDFAEAHNVYISKADFGTGLPLTGDTPVLIIAGSDRNDGRFRTYSLDDPRSPAFLATPATPAGQPGGDRLYMHDGASMVVTDARKNTQCINAASTAYCDVVFDFNESTLDIWDVTNPTAPARLSRTPYSSSGYSHSGWWSEDQQFVFLQDELDERDRGLRTTLRAFSVADLRNPSLAGTWSGPSFAIDHNGFARGNRYYMSNYARGLTILDITDPASPQAVGRFDTYPSGDATGFPGAWGTYPFLPSGHILISDIDSGLYAVADRTLDVPEGSLAFTAESFGADESGPATLAVQRMGGSSGAVSVDWEVIAAHGVLDDVGATTGTLSWAAGDLANKMLSLPVVNDGAAEGLERLIVRLKAPTGGATLAAPNLISLYIGDPGDTATVNFADDQITVPERGFSTAVITLHRGGSASGTVTADYAITGGDATAAADFTGAASGTIAWADGDANPKTIEFEIVDDGSGEPGEFFELTLSNASGASIGPANVVRVDILDGTGVNSAPNSVAGANQTVPGGAQVTLNGSSSNDPEGDTLTYQWNQTLGAAVALASADTAIATFTAPPVTSDVMLRFALEVTDSQGLSDTSSVTVTVRAPGSPADSNGGGALSLWLLALLLFERMRLYDRLLAIRSR